MKSSTTFNTPPINYEEKEYEGIYGKYKITLSDKLEVKQYRIALLTCGISFSSGLIHWSLIGPEYAWIWLIPMSLTMGAALKLIHIYVKPLHQLLQIFWALGCIGTLAIGITEGPNSMLEKLEDNRILIVAIGPLFAALAGIGFKEFFCFGRPEAIGLTLLVPIAILGYLIGVLNGGIVFFILGISAILLTILALRKFGLDASQDIGDKSVFDHLKAQSMQRNQ